MFNSKKAIYGPQMSPEHVKVAQTILAEDGEVLSDETLYDAILFKYGNPGRHVGQIKMLYEGHWSLRRTAGAVAESYEGEHTYVHRYLLPEYVKWLEQHLQGIPFASQHGMQHGDYNPTDPETWLSSLYTHLEAYDQDAKDLKENGGGYTPIYIQDNQDLALAANGWFATEVTTIKEEMAKKTFSPSQALSILREHWEYYTKAPTFCNINRCIEYCIYCAAEFPDTPEARREFRHVLKTLTTPTSK